MELWIRSQDKESLLKVDNIRIKHEYEQKKVNDNYGRVSAYINGKYRKSLIYTDSTWLGEYKSKERALEVLGEIQNILNPMLIFKNCACTKDELDKIKEVGACIVTDNAKLEQINICVFEMPKV